MRHLCLKWEIVTELDKQAINYRRLRLGPSGCLKQHQVLAEANFLCCNVGGERQARSSPSRANLSREGGCFSFPFLVLSCGKKSLEEPDTPVSAARCLPGLPWGKSSAGDGEPSCEEAEQDLHPRSGRSQLLAFGPSCGLAIAGGPEHQHPGLHTTVVLRSSWPMVQGVFSCMQTCLSFPPHPDLSLPAKVGLDSCRGSRWPERWPSSSGEECVLMAFCKPFRATGPHFKSHWLHVCRKHSCITHMCIVTFKQTSYALILLQIFPCVLDDTLLWLYTLKGGISHNTEIPPAWKLHWHK